MAHLPFADADIRPMKRGLRCRVARGAHVPEAGLIEQVAAERVGMRERKNQIVGSLRGGKASYVSRWIQSVTRKCNVLPVICPEQSRGELAVRASQIVN